MVNLLTLDLGITTGWAHFHGTGLSHGTFTDDELWKMAQLKSDYIPEYVVIEKPLIMHGPLGDALEKVIGYANYLFLHRSGVEWVEPGMWKPTPAAKEKVPRGITQHERDAIRMGYWFLRFRLQGSTASPNVPS